MKNRASRDKRLLIANDMPPLCRTQPEQSYDYKTDEVYQWIAKRPALISYLFDKLKFGGYIVYDPVMKKWHGVDYYED